MSIRNRVNFFMGAIFGLVVSQMQQYINSSSLLLEQTQATLNDQPIVHLPTTSPTNTDPPTSTRTLMETVAPAFFPMSGNIIKFPENVTSVMIDIGARDSDYLGVLEKTEDPTIAVIVIDPLPDSIIPLAKRVTNYASRGGDRWLDPIKMNQAFFIRAAMAEHEGHMDFGIALGPACGSILKASKDNKFWCANTKDTIATLALTLKSLLALFPSQIDHINLKVDAEGADLVILHGAGDTISRFDTIIIECNSAGLKKTFRDGECTENEAAAYMSSKGFEVESVPQGDLANMFFTNKHKNVTLHSFFQSSELKFQKYYHSILEKKKTQRN